MLFLFCRIFSDYFFLQLGKMTIDGFHNEVVRSIKLLHTCTRTMSLRACLYSRNLHLASNVSMRKVFATGKPCTWNVYPLIPHFNLEKLGCKGLCLMLTGELIVYSCSGVRPSSTIFKDLLLWNYSANQSQILYETSIGRGGGPMCI